MRALAQWLVSREAALAVGVGLVAPVLWTMFESQLVYYIHEPLAQWIFGGANGRGTSQRWFWRGNQLIYGLLSAVLFSLPLSLAFRRDRFRYGFLFVATFVVAVVAGMVVVGAAKSIPLLFSLPDTWAMIGGSLLVFWLMRHQRRIDLPSNSTPHPDARASSALDQSPSARAGGRGR
jgi:hypothetical protein